MSSEREYNQEMSDAPDHKYAYGFDFEVMHPMTLRSFEPFVRPGNVLELGSFKGGAPTRWTPSSATP